MAITVQAPNGIPIPTCSQAQTFAYDGDDLISATIIYQGITYVQTFTYDAGNLINVSRWINQ